MLNAVSNLCLSLHSLKKILCYYYYYYNFYYFWFFCPTPPGQIYLGFWIWGFTKGMVLQVPCCYFSFMQSTQNLASTFLWNLTIYFISLCLCSLICKAIALPKVGLGLSVTSMNQPCLM